MSPRIAINRSRYLIKVAIIGLLLALLFANFDGVRVVAQTPIHPSIVESELDGDRLDNQGRQAYEMGQFAFAIESWQQGLPIYQQQGDLISQARLWSNLALAYQQLGSWQEADRAIAMSFELLNSDTPHLPTLAQTWNNQGVLQLARGQTQAALQSWQTASELYTQINDEIGIRRSTINQTKALIGLGLYPRACSTILPILDFSELNCQSLTPTALQDKLANLSPSLDSMTMTGWQTFGDILRAMGKLGESQLVLDAIAPSSTNNLLENRGNLLLSLGKTAEALGNYPEALAFYQQATSTSDVIATQSQLAQLHLLITTKQQEAIAPLLPKISANLEKLSLNHQKLEAQINFARSLLLLKQTKANKITGSDTPAWQEIAQLLVIVVQQAQEIGDQKAETYAIGSLGNIYEQTQQWESAQTLTQQALLIAQAIKAPEISYRWQWQLGRIFQAQGDRENAMIAYQEAVKTLKSISSDLAINPEIQFSFQEKVEPIYRELVNLLLQPGKAGEVSQENLNLARHALEDLQLAELNNYFRQACLKAQSVNIDDLDREAAVIYPIILPDRLEIILSLPQQLLRHYSIAVSAAELEKVIAQFRYTLVIRSQRQFSEPAQTLYNWLIRPLETDLAQNKLKTLVFVLDGAWRNIPIAALYDGEKYLIETYEVALTPGLQLLEAQSLPETGFNTLIAGLTEARGGFPALHYVAQEMAAIQTKVPTNILLDRTFTAAALENAIQFSNYPIIHIATHGQFSSNVDTTFILAWDNPINIRQLDTLLRSRSPNPEVPIELLILSACETATGDKQAALGLAGMAVQSGARSTLATLWSINDRATAEFMTQFYQALVTQKSTKAQALRQAQLSLLKNPWYQHPFYWTPYILVGNWQ